VLNILGSEYRFCDGIARRDFLRVGGLGAAGLALPGLFRARVAGASPRGIPAHGRAKACILLFMRGGPSQLDTWDLKPGAPAGIRGEFKPIATNIPGLQICEHFPLLAQRADRYTVVRSVHHENNVHQTSVHYMLTGNPPVRIEREARRDDYPHLGSTLARVRPRRNSLPPFVAVGKLAEPEPGTTAGFLGSHYEPFSIEQDPNAPTFRVQDLLALRADVPVERLARRRGMLDAVTRRAEHLQSGGAAMGTHHEQALDLLGSPKVRRAFDLSAEPSRVRDRYGRHAFGQGVLLARRLVEHGVGLVTVNYYTKYDPLTHWDTHAKNFPLLKNTLMPPTDRAFAALLDDLEARGLLDETLVVWMGEFGRTPRIDREGGRDHWGPCSSVVLAGGGIPGGRVYGSSDSHAAYPRDHPVGYRDLITTIYYALGVDPHTELPDRVGRPTRICNGQVIRALFG
jgi:hypothetical protein